MATVPTPVALLGYRVDVAENLGISSSLALTVAGGVRHKALPIPPGTAPWSTTMPMLTEAASFAKMAFM